MNATTTRPARRGRAAQGEANRTAVLDAAFAVFSAEGYGAASLDRIAEEAGFSKGAVYSRFAGKADLFLAVLERRIDERAETNLREAASARGGDVVARLVELISAASRDDLDWQLAVVEFRVQAARDDELRARYAQLHQRTLARIEHLFVALVDELGLAPAVSGAALARTLMALDLGTALEDAAADAPMAIADRIGVVRAVLGQPAAERARR